MQSGRALGQVTRGKTARAGFGIPKDPKGQQGQRGDRQGELNGS